MSKEKRRKSYITIIIVILIIVIMALVCIKIYNVKKKSPEKVNPSKFYSNLLEEDFMRSEYSKINKELNGLCAFAINGNNVVGVNEEGETINICTINPESTYDYVYNAQKLYLLEKQTGIISVIPLNNEENYEIKSTIELQKTVDMIQIYNNDIYYLSDNVLYKYNEYESEIVVENIENNYFVIKQDYLYVISGSNLLKISMNTKESEIVASKVTDMTYYNYYERNKLIFETSEDEENSFKKIYNYYNGEINNSIKNNGYFIPYNSNEYVYINNDKNKVFLIDNNGSSKVLYSSDKEITNAIFIKKGFVLVTNEEEEVLININSRKVEENNTEKIDNIKYIK